MVTESYISSSPTVAVKRHAAIETRVPQPCAKMRAGVMTCRTPRCFAAKSTLARTLVTKIDALSLGWDGVSRSGSDAGVECVSLAKSIIRRPLGVSRPQSRRPCRTRQFAVAAARVCPPGGMNAAYADEGGAIVPPPGPYGAVVEPTYAPCLALSGT